MEEIAVGVIGAGGMGARHAQNIAQHVVGARVAAVYDLDPVRAQQIAGMCGGAAVCIDPLELIGSTRVDAVLIATPDPFHATLTRACLEQGKPVLCEKPLATNPSDAQQIVDLECALGRQLIAVGFMRRFDPTHVAVYQALAAGKIGRPLLFKGTSRNPIIPADLAPDVAITNSVIHDLDSARWLIGQEATCVYACGMRTHASFSEHTRDLFLIQLSFGDLALATVEATLAVGYGYDISAEVVGEYGVVETLHPDAALLLARQQRSVQIPTDWLSRFQSAYIAELQAWVQSLRGAGPFGGANAWDGYMAALIADACIQSLRSGQPAQVPQMRRPELYQLPVPSA